MRLRGGGGLGMVEEALIEHRLNTGGDGTDSTWIDSVLGRAGSTSNCADQIIDDKCL